MKDSLRPAREALDEGNLETALGALVQAYAGLLKSDSPVRWLPIGWREADALCSEIGRSIAGSREEIHDVDWNDVDLYIATQLYAGGGHTGVIGDFVRSSSSARSMLLLTTTVERDIYPGGEPDPEIIERTAMHRDAVHVCPHQERWPALRWTMEKVREIRPRRVFLFHHPEDAVAVAAVQADAAGAWFMVHHSDRQPSAGLHVPGVEVVDLSPYTAHFSRLVSMKPVHFVPLVVADMCHGERKPFSPGSGGELVTASSGSPWKFGPQYAEVVARTIQTTGGRHIHVGYLKKEARQGIADELSRSGLSPDAFEYVKWVPSLARALRERNVDLLIGSVPIGGARTKIEAFCAATPVLTFHAAGKPRLGVTHLQPDDLPVWQSVDELVTILETIDRAWLERHSRSVRSYYETCHRPEVLRDALLRIDRGETLPPGDHADLSIAGLCNIAELRSSLCGAWAWAWDELPGLSSHG